VYLIERHVRVNRINLAKFTVGHPSDTACGYVHPRVFLVTNIKGTDPPL